MIVGRRTWAQFTSVTNRQTDGPIYDDYKTALCTASRGENSAVKIMSASQLNLGAYVQHAEPNKKTESTQKVQSTNLHQTAILNFVGSHISW